MSGTDTKIYRYNYGVKSDPQEEDHAPKVGHLVVSDDRIAIRTLKRTNLQDAAKNIAAIKSVKTQSAGFVGQKLNKILAKPDRFNAPKIEISLSDSPRKLTQKASFPESGVTVVEVKMPLFARSKFKVKSRNEVRQKLKQDQDLEYAGRVLVDQQTDENVLYTGNALIKFNAVLPREECLKLIAKFKFKFVRALTYSKNLFFVNYDIAGLSIFDHCESVLAANPNTVEYCYPELIRQVSNRQARKVAKTGEHENQWHLRETRLLGGDIINAHCNVVNAWDYATGKGVNIAVIDDGFDIDHHDFEDHVLNGANFSADPLRTDPRPLDPYKSEFRFENHGTSCAGVACGNNDYGSSGVAPDAMLIPIRLSCGLGSVLEAEAVRYAVDSGAHIINCSWGPQDGVYDDPKDPLHESYKLLPPHTRDAIKYAAEKGRGGLGALVVWAAGNGNEDIKYDGYASNEDVIAVGACNDRSRRCAYSDYGEKLLCVFPSGDVKSAKPTPRMPGIWTTDRVGKDGTSHYNYTDRFTGTSSSAPGVAGLIALLLEREPNLTARQVKQRLILSCEPIGGDDVEYINGHNPYYGYGRPNAVTLLFPGGAPEDPETPL